MNNESKKYTIGVDYGTDSVRSIVVNTATGEIVGTDVFYYPRWKQGLYCNAEKNQFRQHPLDYLEGLETTIKNALAQSPKGTAENVVGITVDTTGSTPCAVDEKGTPISLLAGENENPNGMFVLWKDHTATLEAEEINDLAQNWGGVDVTKYVGGVYSSEWFWAKMLHILKHDENIRKKSYSWVEHCDWVTGVLCGNTNPKTMKRSRCAAGHKAMWHSDWGGLPPQEFLSKLSPHLIGIRENLYSDTYTSDTAAGKISTEWANKLDLSTQVVIGVGAFDAHLGAIGAEIRPYYLSKVMGTSTCDMLLAPLDEIGSKLVKGICGQVDGSIVPNMMGLEAGQSAFGDVYAWFKNVLLRPSLEIIEQSKTISFEQKEKLIEELESNLIKNLSENAAKLPVTEHDLVALDWLNGRRTPNADQTVKAAIQGLSLATDATKIFKALVEATAFGAKAIVDCFTSEGVRIDGVIGLGGVSKKSAYVMQTIANVLDMPIQIARAEQACALGSAMAAAVAARVHPNFEAAQKAMGSGFEKTYLPEKEKVYTYKTLYNKYLQMGNLA